MCNSIIAIQKHLKDNIIVFPTISGNIKEPKTDSLNFDMCRETGQ